MGFFMMKTRNRYLHGIEWKSIHFLYFVCWIGVSIFWLIREYVSLFSLKKRCISPNDYKACLIGTIAFLLFFIIDLLYSFARFVKDNKKEDEIKFAIIDVVLYIIAVLITFCWGISNNLSIMELSIKLFFIGSILVLLKYRTVLNNLPEEEIETIKWKMDQ